ncbi:hypothetical protein V5F44_20560 [Xanthobacter sp. V2C-8]|uniref:hypothetical protein n=1 Tax=Xanthobacter albus TaxID=3119929 RepID=UPI0037293F57
MKKPSCAGTHDGSKNSSGNCETAPKNDYHERLGASRTRAIGAAGTDTDDGRARSTFAADKFAWLEAIALDSGLPQSATRVAVALGRYMNWATRTARPAVSTLAVSLDLSENSVRAALRALAARAHLRIDIGGGRGRANLYRMVTPAAAGDDRKGCSETEGLGEVAPETPQIHAPKGFSRLHPNNEKEQSNISGFLHSGIKVPITTAPATPSGQDFADFWAGFPKHEGRAAALAEYRRVVSAGADPGHLSAAARQYAQACTSRTAKYVARAANWLARGEWEDFPRPATGSAAPMVRPADDVSRAVADARRQGARRDDWVFVAAGSPGWLAWQVAFRHADAALAAPRLILHPLPDGSITRRHGARFPTEFPPEFPQPGGS